MAVINPILNQALSSLKSEANKALNENMKGIARKILQQQEIISNAQLEANKKSEAAEEAINLLNEEAVKAQQEFTARFGIAEVVKNERPE